MSETKTSSKTRSKSPGSTTATRGRRRSKSPGSLIPPPSSSTAASKPRRNRSKSPNSTSPSSSSSTSFKSITANHTPRLKSPKPKSPRSTTRRKKSRSPEPKPQPERSIWSLLPDPECKADTNNTSPHTVTTPSLTESPSAPSDSVANVTSVSVESITEDEYNHQTPRVASEEKDSPSVVIVGHVDAGKSTMTGHLLYLGGNIPERTIQKLTQASAQDKKSSFKWAWLTDQLTAERNRGITIGIGIKTLSTDRYNYTLVDAPGHRDFIKNMITGDPNNPNNPNNPNDLCMHI